MAGQLAVKQDLGSAQGVLVHIAVRKGNGHVQQDGCGLDELRPPFGR
jgi:hypothetical protein